MSEPVRLEVGAVIVERLIAAQFPAWARLPVVPVPATGTDNAMFRLGDALAVRLPRVEWAVASVAKEQTWLPRVAPHLPLPVPVPVASGEPGEGYPWPWSVCRWVPGETLAPGSMPDETAVARDLAGFLRTLWAVDASGGPAPGPHNFGRGAPLRSRDRRARADMALVDAVYDPAALEEIWWAALAAPAWDGTPVWIHGDPQGGNLLVRDGRLTGVIDFGGLGVGDPACDLIVAWNLFGFDGRAAFRAAIGVDEATWLRGRGWALSTGLTALPYYMERMPAIAQWARRTLDEVLADAAL